MKFVFLLVCILALVVVHINAFQPSFQRFSKMSSLTRRRMSEESDDSGDDTELPMLTQEQIDKQKKMFDMNRQVKLGRSKDQDGKSNIWSIEPTVEVVEDEGSSSFTKNLFVGGIVIGASLALLPIFNALNGLLPDPADF